MALSNVTITFDVHQILGDDFDHRRIKCRVYTNVADQTLMDTSTDEIRMGDQTVTVASDGTGTFTTWAPGADGNPTSWQTYVAFDYPRTGARDRVTRTFGPYTITASGSLADLEEEQAVPAEYITVVTAALDAKVDEAEAERLGAEDARDLAEQYRDEAHDISGISTSDGVVEALIQDTGSDTSAALSASFDRIRSLDPRNYGAVGDGTTDDTAALQACIDAAGDNGAMELPPLTFKITDTLSLPTGFEIRGAGVKGSIIKTFTDHAAIEIIGGEGQKLYNFKVANSFTGTRTTYDIVIVNPTKPVIESVEVALAGGGSSLAKGGIRIYHDAGQPGDNSFMPQLSKVWIRNGVLDIDDVTDGKMENSFVWSTYTGAGGSIQLTGCGNWTFVNVDVVPPQGDAGGYLLDQVSLISILGGLMDGSYDAIMTGHGIKSIGYVRGLVVKGVEFYNLGRSGLKLDNVRRSVFMGNVFTNCNKADNFYHDIDVSSAQANVFIGNSHSIMAVRTNKSKVYYEDPDFSSDNVFDANVMEYTGNQYSASTVTLNVTSTLGPLNRPHAAFPYTALQILNADATIDRNRVFNGYSFHATGTITVTLPSAAGLHAGNGVPITNTGTGIVTVATVSSQTIDGIATSIALAPGRSITLQSDGAGGNWIVSGAKSLAPAIAMPPISMLLTLVAAPWPSANRAYFQRFSISEGKVYRYLNLRTDTASGNWQAGVVRLTGSGLTSYTRVMSTGVVATPTAGDLHVDLGATYLPAGDYALFVWFDNTTAQTRVSTNSGIPAMRQTAAVDSLTTGVPASGSLTWGGTNFFISGINLETA